MVIEKGEVAMKNIKIFAALFAALFTFAGCGEDNNNPDDPNYSGGSVVGTWHMTSWANSTAADIYVEFASDGTFDLYQRVFSPYYEHLEGTWTANGNTISGKYSDGEIWSSSYTVTFTNEGEKMQLTRTDNTEDVTHFEKGTIPEDILSGNLGVKSESGMNDGFRFL